MVWLAHKGREWHNSAFLFISKQGLCVRLFVLCLCLLSFNAFAVNVSDLYRISVAVDDQSEESRNMGVQWAFQQLLIKVSGYQEVLENPTLVEASQNALRYMQGFSYHQDSVDDQIYLQAWFSKALLIPLMRRAEAPIWGENRPLLLNWLAVESSGTGSGAVVFESSINAASSAADHNGRLLISEQSPEWTTRLGRAFSERGLPVLWPINDLEDQSALSLNQLWWLLSDPIVEASVRYQADAVLAGKLNQSAAGIWQYDGILLRADQRLSIATEGDTPLAALTNVATKVGRFFADQFAIKSDPMNGRSGIRVVVKKVKNFSDYSKVLAYLQSISGVRLVEVAQVDGDNLQLYLNLEGDWDKVQRIIRLDNKLSSLQEKEFEWAQ
ncbi:MAG: hypothetical protein ACI9OH_002732 [Oleispira sp.]